MKRLVRHAQIAAILTLTLSAGVSAQLQSPRSGKINSDQNKIQYVDRQVIVKFEDDALAGETVAVKSSLKAKVLKKFPGIGAELWQISGETVEAAVARYRQDPRIKYIEPNYEVSLIDARIARIPNDPRFTQMWGLHNTGQTGGVSDADIDAPEAWDIETGQSVIIGVIDTGVDWQHEDLSPNIWTNPGEIPGNNIDDDKNGYIDDVRGWDFVNDDNNPTDDYGHGTHVSGTIAAVGTNAIGTVGVSWSAKIMPLKFVGATGTGTTADAILALEYATQMGAHLTSNSWSGGSFSQALYDAIAASGRAGMLFIAAAGNGGFDLIGDDNDLIPQYPSNYDLDNIIAVTATDHNDRIATFGNFGATSVDLGAPGVNILSLFPNNTYGTESGTSMATPHVSGAISLIWSRVPGLTHQRVKDLLLRTVDPLPTLTGRTVSGGRLNVFNALLLAEPDSIPPAAVSDLAVDEPKSNSITLTWTASGDDGDSGKATAYDLRFSTAPIDSANFSQATRAPNVLHPEAAGATESFTVGGLNFNTTYYFALKVLDEQGNASGVSNSPSATTLGIPAIAVFPDSLADSLLTGAQSTQTLTISNQQQGTLDFKIKVIGNLAERASVSIKTRPAPPLANFLRTDLAPDEAADGQFRPRFASQSVNLPFQDGFEDGDFSDWINDSGIGIKEVTNTTAAAGEFSFHYKNTGTSGHLHGIHQEFAAGSQPEYVGFYLRAGAATSSAGYFVLSANNTTNSVIFFFARSTGFFYVNADVGGDESVPYQALQWYHIEFKNLDWTAKNFDYYVDGQLIKADVPFRNADIVNGVDRLDLYNFQLNSDAWWDEIGVGAPAAPPITWLSASPDSGSVLAGASFDVAVTFDATGLNGGDYDAQIVISSNDPNTPVKNIPAHLRVIGAPDIALSDSALNFGAVLAGDTAAVELKISNLGTDVLAVKLGSDNSAYVVSADSVRLDPKKSQEILVRFLPTRLGEFSGALTITSNDPDEPQLTVALRGAGLAAPEIAVSPDSLSENLLTGQIAKKVLTIANSGGSDLNFALAFENIKVTIPVSAALKRSAHSTATIHQGKQNRDAEWRLKILQANAQVTATAKPMGETKHAQAAAASTRIPDPASRIQDLASSLDSPLKDTERKSEQNLVYAVVLDGIGTSSPIDRLWDQLNANWQRFGEQEILIDYATFNAVEITYAGLVASGADVLIISNNWNPLQTYGPFSENEAKAIAQYVNEGAGLYISGGTFNNGIFPELQHQVTYLAPLVGLSPTEMYFWDANIYGPLNFVVPDHPVLRNIPAPFSSSWQFDTVIPSSGTWTTAAIPNGTLVGISTNQQTALVVNKNRVYHSSLAEHATGNESDKQFLYNAITLTGGASWVSADPLTGVVPPNSQAEIEVTFDATGLKGGEYRADLVVANNDPDEKRTVVPIHLAVTGAADIAAAQDTLDFGQVFIGTKATLKFAVQNKGTLDLLIPNIVANPAVYTFSPAFAGIDPGEEEIFTVRFSPVTVGSFPGTLTFASNDPDEPTLAVTLLGQGVTPPDIAVAPPSFAFNLNAGDSANAVMNIANSGGGSALQFKIRNEEAARQKLYWTESLSAPDTLHRSNLDGTAIESIFTSNGSLLGIAVDELRGRLYWIDRGESAIRSSRLDGSDVKIILSNLDSPLDIALDPAARKMYWTDFGASINRANLDGSGATIIVQGLAAASKNGPGPLDHGPAGDLGALALANPWGIALDLIHAKVYWTEQNGNRIARANLDGSGVETVISSGLSGPRGIKLDAGGGKIYFVDSFNDAIKRANLDGSGVETILQLGADRNTLDLEIDISAQHLYWSDNNTDQIQRAGFDGKDVTVITTQPASGNEGPIGMGLQSGVNWLVEQPTDGRIEADSTLDIDIKVHTKGLVDGDYEATIFVASNDPDEPEVSIPVSLHVTGVPSLAVSPDTLDYGEVFIGVAVKETVIVANAGTALLSITGISSDQVSFVADTAKFDLAPGEQRAVVVSFKPETVQAFSGRLTITSNDPQNPSVAVILLGKGLIPPAIAVAPDSLDADLPTGNTETRTLKIYNNGGSNLDFKIAIENTVATNVSPQNTKTNVQTASSHSANRREWTQRLVNAQPLGAPFTLRPSPSAIAAALPVVVQDSTGDGFETDLTIMRGASVFNVLQIEMEFSTTLNTFNFAGFLSVDIDQNPKTGRAPSQGLPGQNIGVEYEFSFFSLGSGQVDLFDAVGAPIGSYPVQITAHTLSFSVPLADLGNDDGKMDVTGVVGDNFGPTDWFPDVGHGTIGVSGTWLIAAPASGVVPPGDSTEILATFTAEGLQGGDYFAKLLVASNDPNDSLVAVPAHLHVTGAPVIAVADTLLSFGAVFVNATASDSLVVSNQGSDNLTVSSITVNHLDYTVNPTGFTLGAGASKAVEVKFKPSALGQRNGILSITSNDLNHPLLQVRITGEGVEPPVAAVNPATFEFHLRQGDSATAIMTISNAGGSPLHFRIRDNEAPSAASRHSFKNTEENSEQKLYWTEGLAGTPDTLHRSNLDGTVIEALFTNAKTGSMGGIAVDEKGQRVYWVDFGERTIRSSKFDGSDVKVVISGLDDPTEMAIDAAAGKIYWTEYTLGTINRANLDGSGAVVIVQGSSLRGMKIPRPTEETFAARTPVAGMDKNSLPLTTPWGIALDLVHGKLYWTEVNTNLIGRANLDGSGVETLISELNNPVGIKLDVAGGKLYFVDFSSGSIKRANLDGSRLETVVAKAGTGPLNLELDIDAQQFYWTDFDSEQILRANFDGSNVQIVAQFPAVNNPFGIGLTLGEGWLSEEPASGTIAAGSSQEIEIKVDAGKLAHGNYSANILVESNDPTNPVITAPVSLQVTAGDLVIAIADTLRGVPNETIDVPVFLALNNDSVTLAALATTLKAGNKILAFAGFTPGPLVQGQTFRVIAPTPDSLEIAFFASGGGYIKQSGLLVTLRFQIAANAAAGTTAPLVFNRLTAADSSAKTLFLAADNGLLTVNQALLISGQVQYFRTGVAKPVGNLDVKLTQNAAAVQATQTDAAGKYQLAGIIPGANYRVTVTRVNGGIGSAITPIDALMALRATLNGAQKLAADVDGNLAVEANDANLIFDFFLGLVAQFPVAAWRAFPAAYNIDATSDAWKTAPDGIDYSSLISEQTKQDYYAVVAGDVDLDWSPAASTPPANLAQGSAEAPLQLSAITPEVLAGAKTLAWHIRLEGAGLAQGVYALGAELQYDTAALEITHVRWGKSAAAESFQLKYRILPEETTQKNEALRGRLRFGGFSTAAASIREAGVILEVESRLRDNLQPGASLPIRFAHVSAVLGRSAAGLSKSNGGTNFAAAVIEAIDGAVKIVEAPKEFALQANYPNPFNPSTRIRYQLPEAATVKLEIFNMLGQKVRTLVNGESQALGYYNVEWNGRNDAEAAVPSGVYFYRFEAKAAAKTFGKTHKMLMVK